MRLFWRRVRLRTPRRPRRSPDATQPRSLRLRLALWYGALLAAALLLFGALVTALTTNAILQSVDTALGAETRVATLDLDRVLQPAPPYWPATLNLHVVDAYRDPGVTVAIFDTQGHVRYGSTSGISFPISTDSSAFAAALAGHTTVLSTNANGEPVRVVVTPIRAPAAPLAPATPAAPGASANSSPTAAAPTAPGASEPSSASGALATQGPVIGVLLVAKSLRDVNTTLLLLRTVLIVTGLAILAAALLGGWGIARRVLRPLALIAATARRIATGTSSGATASPLRHRVPRPAGEDELAHLVDTLNDMLAALEHATVVQRRFVADASHELRAPLTTIQGNLAFLQRHANDLPPEERRLMLADAHGETLRLAHLVDDLLLLARADASSDGHAEEGAGVIIENAPAAAETGAGAEKAAGDGAESARDYGSGSTLGVRPRPPGELIELDHVVLQLVRQLRGRLAAEDSRLRLEVGHVEPARVRGDAETLRRIAVILLDNAMKYTRAGETGLATTATPAPDAGRISVRIERVGDEVALRVRDTGIGIAAADLPHIFERFYRADSARSRAGTGLGLAIAQTLVERLHGRITVESEPGRGSTFTVWLPAAGAVPASPEP